MRQFNETDFLLDVNAKEDRCLFKFNVYDLFQARIAQLVSYRLGTREVLGSNPSKGENFSVKISNWIY